MQINGPSHIHRSQPVSGPHRVQGTTPQPPAESLQAADELDISAEAEMASLARPNTEIRTGLVENIRQQIEAGTYETDGKLETAVGRLLDELVG